MHAVTVLWSAGRMASSFVVDIRQGTQFVKRAAFSGYSSAGANRCQTVRITGSGNKVVLTLTRPERAVSVRILEVGVT